MDQAGIMDQAGRLGTADRARKEANGEILGSLRGGEESFSELAHDARNMVTALALYCELLEEPGVLAEGSMHFAQELRVVTAASWKLLEKLARAERRGGESFAGTRTWRSSPLVEALPGTQSAVERGFASYSRDCSIEIADLAAELESNHNVLSALAGPGVAVRVKSVGAACPVALKSEDLTRLLVNLVRNSIEAMHGSGTIKIALTEGVADEVRAPRVRLTVEDDGPGIPASDLERVFEKGFRSQNTPAGNTAKGRRTSGRRGLGLSIARNLVEAAGGRIAAGNRSSGGARIAIEMPILTA